MPILRGAPTRATPAQVDALYAQHLARQRAKLDDHPLPTVQSIAGPIVEALCALRELGQRCAALELLGQADDSLVAEARATVATARRIADLCSSAAHGCVVGGDAGTVGAAMRLVVESVAQLAPLALALDAGDAWHLVELADAAYEQAA